MGITKPGEQEKPIKRAVVIGINKYRQEGFDRLSGAVLDATEIHDILKNNGDFEIDANHFLTDEDATGDNIRAAISDLFWKSESCEIALFYYAGHARRDYLGDGYLVPHDADPAAPFAKGIRFAELRELFFKSKTKQTAIMILDCCYSGMMAERGDGNDQVEDLQARLLPPEITNGGSGRFIYTAAGANQKAREMARVHADGSEHVHGLLTFHLIEALNVGETGKTRDEHGQISLFRLEEHILKAYEGETQKPVAFSCKDTARDKIYLARNKEIYTQHLKAELRYVEDRIAEGDPVPVIRAIRKLKDLGKRQIEITQYLDKIRELMPEHQQALIRWWLKNREIVWEKTRDSWSFKILDDVLNCFDIDSIMMLDEMQINCMCIVLGHIKTNSDLLTISRFLVRADINSSGNAGPGVRGSPIVSPNPRTLLAPSAPG
jgi:hypothetical protein